MSWREWCLGGNGLYKEGVVSRCLGRSGVYVPGRVWCLRGSGVWFLKGMVSGREWCLSVWEGMVSKCLGGSGVWEGGVSRREWCLLLVGVVSEEWCLGGSAKLGICCCFWRGLNVAPSYLCNYIYYV